MHNFKNHFKQRLMEELMEDVNTVELSNYMDDQSRNLDLQGNVSDAAKIYRKKRELEHSPHLYRLNKTTGQPEQVEGVVMSPHLQKAIDSAVRYGVDGGALSPHHVRTLRSFVAKHGDLMGNTRGDDPYPLGTMIGIRADGPWSTDPGLDDSGAIGDALGYREGSIERRRDRS